MDIVEFLTARLDEDEQLAREAEYSSGDGTWLFEGPPSDGKSRPGRLKLGDGPWLVSDPELRAPTFGDNFDGHQMEHIARHDPARVLRDVAAKRKLLGAHREDKNGRCRTCANWKRNQIDDDGYKIDRIAYEGVAGPCTTRRLLALPYADHPDYDEAWRVD